MSRRLIGIGTALAVALAFAFSMAGGEAVAGEGCKASAKTASSSCATSAKTASAGMCTKSAVASGCCASGKSAVAGYTKTGDAAKKETSAERNAALNKVVDNLPYREATRIVVAGNMQCGHCSYQATASCAPLLKTTDGKVYPLAPGNLVEKMHAEKAKEGFEVTARVRKMDGIKYLDVLTFTSL